MVAFGLSREGFTLVEMMVVVGIVGMLSSIAIPEYSKFVGKARQSEAKINLAAIYVAETSFVAESSFFSACLAQIGYSPDGANRYYTIGFDHNSASYSFCGMSGTSPCNWINSSGSACNDADVTFPAANISSSDIVFSATLAANPSQAANLGSSYMQTHFPFTGIANDAIHGTLWRAGANGSISSGSPYDSWSIDNTNDLFNLQSGL